MGYRLKLFLYYLNILALLLTAVLLVYSIVKLFVHTGEWFNRFYNVLLNLLIFIFVGIIHIVRKSKYPVPGKDYR